MNGLRVLVTGGAGFIGSNLCHRLLLSNHIDHVRVIDDLSSGSTANLSGLSLDFRHASILDDRSLRLATKNCNAIVHLAAVPSVARSIDDPVASHEANATGTLRVLEAARAAGGAHVVFAGSSSVYGANATLPKSESLRCDPMSPYAVSKLAAEQYAVSFGRVYGLPVLPFRFFNVYGPHQAAGHAYAAVVPAFVDAALAGRPIPVAGDGKQTRDFTYVGTVVEVLHSAVVRHVTSDPVNLAFGTRVSLMRVIELLEKALERPLEFAFQPPRSGDVKHSQADNARLRTLFPNVQPTSLADGLKATIDWHAQANNTVVHDGAGGG